ncbi:GGDEF domain-containing protein [Vibrio sp. TBV020]|uniref:GGDEF domain-containing protein n=1 Tax=Vibrio sp. TBV020 TaxID=3137398 RepID=UPI0038CD16D2
MRQNKIYPYLITTTLFFLFVVSAYYAQKYQQTQQEIVSQTSKQALHQLAYSEREYRSVRNQFVSVIELLSHSRNLYEYVLTPSEANKAVVEDVWSSVAANQKWYTQIRYLDVTGTEKIRLNYLHSDERVFRSSQLQDKSERDYFQYATSLKENEIGAWGIDLEQDYGKHVEPYRPTLRLLTPVYVQGVRSGYLVLNIDVWYLASRLNFSPNKRFRPELIGEEGYYLASENQSKLFGNLIETREQYNFALRLPMSWKDMQERKSGFVREAGGLVVFNQIGLSPKKKLYLVIHFDEQQMDEIAYRDLHDLFQEAILVFLITLAFVMPAALLISRYRQRSIESQLARAALSGMSAMIISDRRHRVIRVNEQFTKLTGLDKAEVQSKNIIKLFLGEEQLEETLSIFEQVARHQLWEGELVFRHFGTGELVTTLGRVQSVLSRSGKVSYYITSIVDISDRKQLEERLRVLSERDALTQLWNRRKFELKLRHYSGLIRRYPEMPTTCLALLDIDYFKRINDEFGHDEGDRVITETGRMLERILRETDFVARIGGEEFAIIMPNTSLHEALLGLERLRVAIDLEPNIPVTVSIGVTELTADNVRSYKHADIALYESKAQGRNRVSRIASEEEVA